MDKRRVLFLCTHNSARSQMAEGLLRHDGGDRFDVFSAGTVATAVRPLAIRAMQQLGIDISHQESKTLDRYLGEPFDEVITVCDQAAGEACPHWPGQPTTAHWGIEDPSNLQGSEIERERAFVTALRYLRNRINVLLSLPVASLDEMALAQQVRRIGSLEGASGCRPEVA